MCKVCPRELGVKRYWYLPHWTAPHQGRLLARFQANSYHNPTIVQEFECTACDFVHVGHAFFKFRNPVTVDGFTATHFSTCPDKNVLVYLRGL